MPTKTQAQIVTSQSNAGGGSTTSSWRDLTSKLGAVVTMSITNGATAPTTPCDMIVQISHDNGTTIRELARATGPDGNSESQETTFSVPAETSYYRVKFEGNDDQSVTVVAETHELDSVA